MELAIFGQVSNISSQHELNKLKLIQYMKYSKLKRFESILPIFSCFTTILKKWNLFFQQILIKKQVCQLIYSLAAVALTNI